MLDMKDKVVVITGATRGIGLETAKLFLESGACVIILGSKEESVTNAITTLSKEGYSIDGFYPNLNDYSAVKETINKIIDKYESAASKIVNSFKPYEEKIETLNSLIDQFVEEVIKNA